MNRALLMIVVTALLVAAGYLAVFSHLGLPVNWLPFFGAGAAFLIAGGIVRLYRRRKARPTRG